MTSVQDRVAKTIHSARLTGVDMTNKMMRHTSKTLENFCADLLFSIAKQACGVANSDDDLCTPSLVLKCVHDSIADPCTGKIISPHLVADCTHLCNYIADFSVKKKYGNTKQPQLYEVLASNAVKKTSKLEKTLVKLKKAVEKAAKKAVQAAAKATKSGKPGNKAAQATAKALNKAEAKLLLAQTEVKTAAAAATEATAKAAQATSLAHSIALVWCEECGNVASSSKPACLKACQVCLPPCAKCKGSQCQCT